MQTTQHTKAVNPPGQGPLIRRQHTLILLLCLIFLALGICCLNNTIYYTPDSVDYLAWAESLVSFQGWSMPLVPEPMHYVANAPLYSVLLAPVARLFPYDVVAAKAFTLCCGVLTLFLFYSYVEARTGRTAALWGSFFLLINPLFLMFSTQVLSDVPFGLCLMLFFILAEKIASEKQPGGGLIAAFTVVVAGGILLREIGFALLLSATVFYLSKRNYRLVLIVLAVSLLSYLLWMVRNEVIVAGMENPQWRNSRLFFSHVLTGSQDTLFKEFIARLGSNLTFYGALLGRLVSMPQYLGWVYDVVRESERAYQWTQAAVRYAEIPVAATTLLLFAYGLYRIVRDTKSGRLVVLFLLFYCLIVAFYPINDVRFLFPLLLIMTYGCATAGWHVLARRRQAGSFATAGATIVLVLLAVPNIVWTENFIGNNLAYNRSPSEFSASLAGEKSYPGEFTKLFHDAGRWLIDHSDTSAVIISNNRELGLWSGGRKIVNANPVLSLDEFETLIRDYRVSHCVCVLTAHVLRDYELQIALTHRYRFTPVYHVGDVEVLSVEPRLTTGAGSAIPTPTDEPQGRQLFLEGTHLLSQSRYQEAEKIFRRLGQLRGMEVLGTYFTGITLEFSMRLNEATDLFEQFRTIPQAGIYLWQAQNHLNLLHLLQLAQRAQDAGEKAYYFHTVSSSYWQLGFRPQAMSVMQRALTADPAYFPALIFSSLYTLQQGDTVSARSYAAQAERAHPENELSRSLKEVFSQYDALPQQPTTGQRTEHALDISRCFVSMGLYDLAIDQTLQILRSEPADRAALRQLADMYLAKQRFEPAVRALVRLCAADSSDAHARKELVDLLSRW